MDSRSAQLPLLARKAPAVPAEVHALSRPARTFTGDFYFVHRYEDRLWFGLGDVAGKGLPAAVVMAMIQEEIEHRLASCAATRCDPAVTLARLDAFLRPLLGSNRFATAVIGHLREDGMLTLANGGHCPPLILRRDGTVDPIASTGPVAGLLPQPRWSSVTRSLAPGESLLLYTDGLTEARTDGCAELGIDGIIRLLPRNAPAARPLAEGLVSEVERAGYLFDDDLTLLVVRHR